MESIYNRLLFSIPLDTRMASVHVEDVAIAATNALDPERQSSWYKGYFVTGQTCCSHTWEEFVIIMFGALGNVKKKNLIKIPV